MDIDSIFLYYKYIEMELVETRLEVAYPGFRQFSETWYNNNAFVQNKTIVPAPVATSPPLLAASATPASCQSALDHINSCKDCQRKIRQQTRWSAILEQILYLTWCLSLGIFIICTLNIVFLAGMKRGQARL